MVYFKIKPVTFVANRRLLRKKVIIFAGTIDRNVFSEGLSPRESFLFKSL